MPSISLVETALPAHRIDQSSLREVTEEWLGTDRRARDKFLRIAAGAGIEARNLIRAPRDTLSLNGLADRARLFEEHGAQLMQQALDQVLARYSGAPEDFGFSLFVSCTVPTIPCIDGPVLIRNGFSPSISRIPIFQSGCAAGVVGIGLGAKLASLGRPVILTSVELCSLVFHPDAHDPEQLVGAAIFADGAAVAVIEPGDGLSILDSMSVLLPGSEQLMGYHVRDDGFYLRLLPDLPSVLCEQLPHIVDRFLRRNELSVRDIEHWLIHPGGKKILDSCAEQLGLRDEQYQWSRAALREHGNLSSASILFVLQRFLRSPCRSAGHGLIIGIGPGLTVELVLVSS